MLNCFFIQNFTSKFKSTGRATLHTNLIDRQAFYSTRASGLYLLIRRLVVFVKYVVPVSFGQNYVASFITTDERLQ